jgi:hypothetical protein
MFYHLMSVIRAVLIDSCSCGRLSLTGAGLFGGSGAVRSRCRERPRKPSGLTGFFGVFTVGLSSSSCMVWSSKSLPQHRHGNSVHGEAKEQTPCRDGSLPWNWEHQSRLTVHVEAAPAPGALRVQGQAAVLNERVEDDLQERDAADLHILV